MYHRITSLSFVIGAFFTIISLILLGNILITKRYDTASIISALSFLVFGMAMMAGSKNS